LRTVVVVDVSAHVRGGDVELIVEQRGTKEEIATEETAVVEGVASDHADDVGPVVEETGWSMLAVMEGEEEALQGKELVKAIRSEAMRVCFFRVCFFQDKKKHRTHDTFRRIYTIARHIG
jgi:hypothetical protein